MFLSKCFVWGSCHLKAEYRGVFEKVPKPCLILIVKWVILVITFTIWFKVRQLSTSLGEILQKYVLTYENLHECTV